MSNYNNADVEGGVFGGILESIYDHIKIFEYQALRVQGPQQPALAE